MCGVVGIVGLKEERIDESPLEGMMGRIASRGPDARGTWHDGKYALGHLRLSILDLSDRGRQPFLTDDGTGVLSYNGEVYNYISLRQELESSGVVFHSTTDTEVVLQALHQWGPEKAIPRFNGMFALAYVDRRSGAMWLARDRLGIKPLYITKTSRSLVFASEIKSVLAHPDVTVEPDRHALTCQMLLHRLDAPATPFVGVEAVRPGTWLRVQGDRIHRQVYFDVVSELDTERVIQASHDDPAQMINAFYDAMSESVRIHLASDAPLATACSGGVDSSLVSALARTHRPDVVAYVADVQGTVSEGERARRAAESLGIALRVVSVSSESYLKEWPAATWYGDQPSTHANDIPLLAVARACRADGIKVLVTGEGADELFGGYDWQRQTLQRWQRHDRRDRFGLHSGKPMFWRVRKRAPWVALPTREDMESNPFHELGGWLTPPGLTTSLVASLDAERLLRGSHLYRQFGGVGSKGERAFLAQCIDDMYGHLESLLRRNDRMGMAASLETRVPFLENRLIDFGMHAPFRAKYHDKQGKWVVKQVAARYLPNDIVYAPKIGFAFDAKNALFGLPLLRSGVAADIFRWTASTTEALIAMFSQDMEVAWTAVSIELWGRLFLRGQSPDELSEALILNRASTAGA